MTTERQTTERTDNRENDRQTRTRGVLESDCAVYVAPSASAAAGFHHHSNIAFVQQELGRVELNSHQWWVVSNSNPAHFRAKDISTDLQLDKYNAQSRLCCGFRLPTATGFLLETGEDGLKADLTETKMLEAETERLQMEDEPDENGDT